MFVEAIQVKVLTKQYQLVSLCLEIFSRSFKALMTMHSLLGLSGILVSYHTHKNLDT